MKLKSCYAYLLCNSQEENDNAIIIMYNIIMYETCRTYCFSNCRRYLVRLYDHNSYNIYRVTLLFKFETVDDYIYF